MKEQRLALSVVMPAHNEEPYLEAAVSAVVEGLAKRAYAADDGLPFEVIVVENGSADHTIEVARKLAESHPEVRVLSRPQADYGLALRAGFLAAGGDLVVNFDVDYVDLAFLDAALALMASPSPGHSSPSPRPASPSPRPASPSPRPASPSLTRAPIPSETAADASARPVIVVGSKRGPGADDHRSAGRRVVTAVFSGVLRHGFGLRVSDTHGVKLLRRPPLVPLVAACRFGADIFDTELILRAERAGWSVAEIPVTVNDQRPPRTPILRRIPRSLLGLGRLRVALWRERIHPRV
jgi:glycosyltransferase AglD